MEPISRVEGTAVLFTLGVRLVGPDGVDRNTMEHLLGTDSRHPPAKHRILEMYVEHGFEPPDTPVMALHRGRVDLLVTSGENEIREVRRETDRRQVAGRAGLKARPSAQNAQRRERRNNCRNVPHHCSDGYRIGFTRWSDKTEPSAKEDVAVCRLCE